MTSLEAPLGFPGELFLFAGKGVDFRLLGEEEKKEVWFFSLFPCNWRENPYLFACLSLCAIVLFLFMRGRVFLVVAPRVFYLGGFSVSVERVSFFCFSLAIGEEIRILVALLLSGINVYKWAGRETRKLLRSSLGFLLGAFSYWEEGIRFSCFSLAFREEIRILGLFSFVESKVLWAN